jgi:UDP-N-acetyl-D-glucosamine dehydrogenase
VSDIRESPALAILGTLLSRGCQARYHDPHVPEIGRTRDHPLLQGLCSVPLAGLFDAVVIVTDHDAVDYAHLSTLAPVIIDTRNVMARKHPAAAGVVKA